MEVNLRTNSSCFFFLCLHYKIAGLTLLLPYIISTRSNWAACQFRVFCTANNHEEVEKEREGYVQLQKYIHYAWKLESISVG